MDDTPKLASLQGLFTKGTPRASAGTQGWQQWSCHRLRTEGTKAERRYCSPDGESALKAAVSSGWGHRQPWPPRTQGGAWGLVCDLAPSTLCSPEDGPHRLNSTTGHGIWKPVDVAHIDVAPRAESMAEGGRQVDPWDQTVSVRHSASVFPLVRWEHNETNAQLVVKVDDNKGMQSS